MAANICAEMAEGKSFRKICLQDGYPALPTLMRWLNENQLFREQTNYARAYREDFLFEDGLEKSDDTSGDFYELNGKRLPNNANVQRSRLMVETRKWFLSKLNPKRFGERLDVSGEVSMPVRFVIEGAPRNRVEQQPGASVTDVEENDAKPNEPSF